MKLICLTSVVENRRRKDAIQPSVHLCPDASWVQVPVNHQHLEKKGGKYSTMPRVFLKFWREIVKLADFQVQARIANPRRKILRIQNIFISILPFLLKVIVKYFIFFLSRCKQKKRRYWCEGPHLKRGGRGRVGVVALRVHLMQNKFTQYLLKLFLNVLS